MITINNKLRKVGGIFSDILQRDEYNISAYERRKSDKHSSKDYLALPETLNLHGRPSLDLSMKELQIIPRSAFKNTNLCILKLNANFIQALPFELAKLHHLEELYLQNNKMHFVPAQICALIKLQVLDVSFNNINMLPYSISHLKSLRVLDLAYNNIKMLPESLGFLQSLEILVLDGNRIGEDSDVVFGLSNLFALKLRSNDLKTLPKHLSKLKKLKELCINDNNITKIPESLKSFLRKLDSLEMDIELRKTELANRSSPLLNCLKTENEIEKGMLQRMAIKNNSIHQHASSDSAGEKKTVEEHADNDPVYQFTSYAFPNLFRNKEKETEL